MAVKGVNMLNSMSKSNSGDASEVRAQAVEAEAQRRAAATQREAREKADDLRESAQRKEAHARVAAANSGLTLSGSPLLTLEGLEHDDDEKVDDVLGDASQRAQDILDSGSDQARSIRLSGRSSRNSAQGLASLLSLGGRALESRYPTITSTIPTGTGPKQISLPGCFDF
jgi:hypothetical protein